MQLRYPVLISPVAIVSFFLACNRHATTTVDSFNGPVRGDTVAFYPSMIPQLRQDSINNEETYYLRINRVKRVEIIDNSGREVQEIDRFGHELTEECYIDGDLFWRNVDVYNRYGHVSSDRHAFYNDEPGKEDLVFESTYEYEQNVWILGERLVSIEMESRDYDTDERKVYAYNYYYKEHLLDYEVRYENGRCTEKVYYTYNEFDMPLQLLTIAFEDTGPDTTIRIYKYDEHRREVNWSETRRGILLNDHPTEYNSDGRMSKYSSITYEPYSSFVFEYFYLSNGLIDYRLVTRGGGPETETERYRYAFY